ncbi:HesB/IscA family protein [Limnochorda pilosa]|uniref:Iron-sulfur binding protein n=1 Tax=Limnochorda pilosa TaxID=1555112 RepID=A0A0K2SPH5_LIMPI|nr:iron-sulfur cluster assembly accessory protein [Limnochorda pilosa]BAS29025.1 iron-sulfur binding protein [Limnochorda pilosa]
MNVLFTEEATRQLDTMVRQQGDPAPALRIAVTGQCHCGSIHFGMAWEQSPRPDDIVLEHGDLRVVVDPASAPHLDEATIDYRSDPMNSGFLVRAAAGGGCGCGG